MQSSTGQVNGGSRRRAPIAVAALLVLGLAGCAADPARRPVTPGDENGSSIGVFTGEYVDGKPFYRFPAIYIVGLRGSAGSD